MCTPLVYIADCCRSVGILVPATAPRGGCISPEMGAGCSAGLPGITVAVR